MRHPLTAHRILFLAMLLIAACVTTARAQAGGPYEITKPTIAAGSSTSSGGNYVVIGTIAQHDAVVMGGGSYLFDGGFWPERLDFAQPISPRRRYSRIEDLGRRVEDQGGLQVDLRTGRYVQTVKITNMRHDTMRDRSRTYSSLRLCPFASLRAATYYRRHSFDEGILDLRTEQL